MHPSTLLILISLCREFAVSPDGTVVNFRTHAGRATEPASYEVLGPAPSGERCVYCGKGSGVKRIKHGGEVDLLHEGCARNHLVAMANRRSSCRTLGQTP
jgi:hypothetical protein